MSDVRDRSSIQLNTASQIMVQLTDEARPIMSSAPGRILEELTVCFDRPRQVALLEFADEGGTDLLPAVTNVLRHDVDPALRAEAARALAGHDDVEVVSGLGWLKFLEALGAIADRGVNDSDEEVRRISCGASGMAAPVSELASAALIAALRDPAWQLREEAATTLGKFEGEQRISAALREALEDDHRQGRLRAARSLGRMRDELSVPLLIASLIHPVGNLRKESAIALGEIGDASAIPALNATAVDPDPEVRKAVGLALQRLERN
jgi:hypothetical protein